MSGLPQPRSAKPAPPRRFAAFAGVGAVGFCIDAGVLLAITGLAGGGPYIGRVASFALAVTATWLLNRRWVFPDRAASGGKGTEYGRYFTVQSIGALINLALYAGLIESLAMMAAYPVLALSIGAAVALGFNFLGARYLVFTADRAEISKSPVAAAAASNSAGQTPYTGVDNLEVMEEARNYNRFLIDLIEAAAGGHMDILDFGAGSGTLAAGLSERGYKVACVEPDTVLRQMLDRKGLTAHANLSELAPGSVAFAYSLNVLEHIEDDAAALTSLWERLRPGARLLVYVPAFQILYSAMDRKVGHVRRYRRSDLSRRLEGAGFAVERARYVDSAGFFAALLYRAIGSESGDLDGAAVRAYDRVVFPVSRLIDRVTWPVVGKNLLVIARRP